MVIDELLCKDFRNYRNLKLVFHPHVNFIIGPNGVGKTNILEAVSVAANLKTFRHNSDSDIIRWGEKSYYSCVTVVDDKPHKYEVGYLKSHERVKKKAKIDSDEIKRVSDYYGKLLIVVLTPQDITIINEGPEIRRRFFDSSISKIYPQYLEALSEYRKILSSRNRLLRDLKEKRNLSGETLDIWDRMIAEKMAFILNKRISFIEEYSVNFRDSHRNIAGGEAPLIVYRNTSGSVDSDAIIFKLKQMRHKDLKRGITGFGPHRDDYIIENNKGIPFTGYASQGQRRTASIALKIAEFKLLERKTGKKCVILVDDIFSELDEKRRKNMIELLKEGNQVIITMVHSSSIDMAAFGEHRVFSVVSEEKVEVL